MAAANAGRAGSVADEKLACSRWRREGRREASREGGPARCNESWPRVRPRVLNDLDRIGLVNAAV